MGMLDNGILGVSIGGMQERVIAEVRSANLPEGASNAYRHLLLSAELGELLMQTMPQQSCCTMKLTGRGATTASTFITT
jgi:hypothetical protein